MRESMHGMKSLYGSNPSLSAKQSAMSAFSAENSKIVGRDGCPRDADLPPPAHKPDLCSAPRTSLPHWIKPSDSA